MILINPFRQKNEKRLSIKFSWCQQCDFCYGYFNKTVFPLPYCMKLVLCNSVAMYPYKSNSLAYSPCKLRTLSKIYKIKLQFLHVSYFLFLPILSECYLPPQHIYFFITTEDVVLLRKTFSLEYQIINNSLEKWTLRSFTTHKNIPLTS